MITKISVNLPSASRHTWSGLKHSAYIMVRPFDGFWCSQREKKGNAASATLVLGILIAVLIFSRQLTGFIFNYNDPRYLNIIGEIMSVMIPFMLWCIVNWSVTTLMDGEGTFRDIYITSAYSMGPMALLTFIQTIISNIVSIEEGGLLSLLSGFAIVWTGFLLFAGIMTIQQYSIRKTIFTIIVDIVGMVAILFLILLFFALIQQTINFLFIFYTEITMRFR